MSAHFTSESDLAKRVIEWLHEAHWEVYQEVQPYTYGHTADIVAVQNRIVWVIETKLAFSLEVIWQANGWKHMAHYVSAAVPMRRHSNDPAEHFCRLLGVGVLTVGHDVIESVRPKLFRRSSYDTILKCCRDAHKTFAAAGNACGSRWTPFAQTCRNLRDLVVKEPGVSLKDAITKVEHHYGSTATARSCIAKWGEQGKIKGVEFRRDGRRITLFPL